MRTTIDKAGRVVIPKALRESLWLEPGTEIDICELEDGSGLAIKPAPMEFRRVKRGRGFVLEPTRPAPPLTVEKVRRMIDDVRSEPLRRVLEDIRDQH